MPIFSRESHIQSGVIIHTRSIVWLSLLAVDYLFDSRMLPDAVLTNFRPYDRLRFASSLAVSLFIVAAMVCNDDINTRLSCKTMLASFLYASLSLLSVNTLHHRRVAA